MKVFGNHLAKFHRLICCHWIMRANSVLRVLCALLATRIWQPGLVLTCLPENIMYKTVSMGSQTPAEI